MQFGFRFLRQVLFGEETIPLRREAAEQRRLRHLERQQRLATEAAARRAMEQDEMYADRLSNASSTSETQSLSLSLS